MRLFAALLIGLVLTAGCSSPSRPGGATPQAGLEATMGKPVAVVQEVVAKDDRLLLFRNPPQPEPSVVLMTQSRWNRWEVAWQSGWTVGPLQNIGPVSFDQNPMGAETWKVSNGTVTRPKYLVTHGTVNDPRITWVEVTLLEGDRPTQRTEVRSGTWLVWFPRQTGDNFPDFSIRGGSGAQELFAIPNGWDAVPKQR